MEKQCLKCGVVKPFADFHKRKDKNDGLQTTCKNCGREYRKANREANREKVAEYRREYREANREKVAEYMREYRKADREKIAEMNRKYREANPEKIAEYRREYRKANREKIAEYKREYRKANPEKFVINSCRDYLKNKYFDGDQPPETLVEAAAFVRLIKRECKK